MPDGTLFKPGDVVMVISDPIKLLQGIAGKKAIVLEVDSSDQLLVDVEDYGKLYLWPEEVRLVKKAE